MSVVGVSEATIVSRQRDALNPQNSNLALSVGDIAGISVGSAAGAVLIAFIVVSTLKRRKAGLLFSISTLIVST